MAITPLSHKIHINNPNNFSASINNQTEKTYNVFEGSYSNSPKRNMVVYDDKTKNLNSKMLLNQDNLNRSFTKNNKSTKMHWESEKIQARKFNDNYLNMRPKVSSQFDCHFM